MPEKFWVSNFSSDDIRGGAEILGEEYCKALKLKYMSGKKFGISLKADIFTIAKEIDDKLANVELELLVHNSINCWSNKANAKKSVAVCCEKFDKEGKAVATLSTQFDREKKLGWEYQKKSLANSDKTITISRGEGKSFSEVGFPNTVIEPFIDLTQFHPIEDCRRNPNTALFVGRVHIRKGYDIIEGLEKLHPDINFIVATDGNLTYEQLNELYNKCEFLLMPSRYESFGFIFAEALATNLPIIASRVGLFEDWQPEQHGIFPETITVEAFDEAINNFRKREFEPSRRLAEKRFSFDRFKEEINCLL